MKGLEILKSDSKLAMHSSHNIIYVSSFKATVNLITLIGFFCLNSDYIIS